MIEHIVEGRDWADQLQVLLSPFDVFWVGVHAPLAEIERRERSRGNRQYGEGLYHLKSHQFCTYNVEVDTTKPMSENVTTIISGWNSRPRRI